MPWSEQPAQHRAADPVRRALVQSRLEAVVRAMNNTLLRSARSGILGVAKDFSCCILTADDQQLAWTESIPIHVLCGPDIISRWMKEWHPELRRGDAFLHNSPYHGNSH
ncbi:MAG: hydantoinase B/oxoprolinase family protein, partial [Patulibacter sp.]